MIFPDVIVLLAEWYFKRFSSAQKGFNKEDILIDRFFQHPSISRNKIDLIRNII